MNKASTAKTSADAPEDVPLRRADIAAGTLVLRKRAASGAVLPNKRLAPAAPANLAKICQTQARNIPAWLQQTE